MPSGRPPLLRIVATMAVALAISAVAVMLGFWQYGRHVERADAVAAYNASVDLPVTDLSEVVPPGATSLADGAEWRTVTATGTFDADSVTVLRSRPVLGTPAWQYLAWLDTDDGQSLLVSLGWIPQPPTGETATPPELAGHVTVTVVLRAWEEDDGKRADDSVSRIAEEQLGTPANAPVPGYGMVRQICTGTVCASTAIGEAVPLPTLSLGPHLAYAWQWWLFAVMAPVGAVLLLRRDARMADEAAEAASASAPPTVPADLASQEPEAAPRRRRRRQPTDEEIEDAL